MFTKSKRRFDALFKIVGITFILFSLSFVIASCGDDYKESGIEGQWRLRQIQTSDGRKTNVDTVFYSFKKNVFRYLKLKTPTDSFYCYGNYSISGDNISIEISRDSFEPKDDEESFDWDQLIRTYTIRKHTSSVLELEYQGDIYYLSKY